MCSLVDDETAQQHLEVLQDLTVQLLNGSTKHAHKETFYRGLRWATISQGNMQIYYADM